MEHGSFSLTQILMRSVTPWNAHGLTKKDCDIFLSPTSGLETLLQLPNLAAPAACEGLIGNPL
jgi:hypothetical protein